MGGDAAGWGFRRVDGVTSPTGAFLHDVRGQRRRRRRSGREGEKRSELRRLQSFSAALAGRRKIIEAAVTCREPPRAREARGGHGTGGLPLPAAYREEERKGNTRKEPGYRSRSGRRIAPQPLVSKKPGPGAGKERSERAGSQLREERGEDERRSGSECSPKRIQSQTEELSQQD